VCMLARWDTARSRTLASLPVIAIQRRQHRSVGMAATITPQRHSPRQPAGDTHDVFLTHAGPSREVAEKLCQRLTRDLGLSVFLDRHMLPEQQANARLLACSAQRARVALVLVDRAFPKRKWPLQELHALWQRGAVVAALLPPMTCDEGQRRLERWRLVPSAAAPRAAMVAGSERALRVWEDSVLMAVMRTLASQVGSDSPAPGGASSGSAATPASPHRGCQQPSRAMSQCDTAETQPQMRERVAAAAEAVLRLHLPRRALLQFQAEVARLIGQQPAAPLGATPAEGAAINAESVASHAQAGATSRSSSDTELGHACLEDLLLASPAGAEVAAWVQRQLRARHNVLLWGPAGEANTGLMRAAAVAIVKEGALPSGLFEVDMRGTWQTWARVVAAAHEG
jgi:hypothetical protein